MAQYNDIIIRPKQKEIQRDDQIALKKYLADQFDPAKLQSFAHSLTILKDYGVSEIQISKEELVSENPDSRIKVIQELQKYHSILNYQSTQVVEAFVNIITKVLFCHLNVYAEGELSLQEVEEILDELNLDITLPVSYMSKIFTISKATSQNQSQANRYVRKQLAKILSTEDSDSMENFSSIILELASEDIDLTKSLLREILFETNKNTNLLRHVYYSQDEWLGTYRPISYYEKSRTSTKTLSNNIEAICFAEEVSVEYVDRLIQQYVATLNDEYLPFYEPEISYHYESVGYLPRPDEISYENNIEENPVLSIILETNFIKGFLFDHEGDLIHNSYNERIEIVTYLLQVLMEKRDHWVTIKDKKTGEKKRVLKSPYVESYYKFINVQAQRFAGMFKEFTKINFRDNFSELSQVELVNHREAVEQIGSDISQETIETIQPVTLIQTPANNTQENTEDSLTFTQPQPEQTSTSQELTPETQEVESPIVKQIVDSLVPVLRKAGSKQNQLLEEFIAKITEQFGPQTAKISREKISESLKSKKSSFKLR